MRLEELERRFANFIRIGTIAEVDFAAARVRIATGDLLSDWLPVPADIGKNYRRWHPLRVGTQVVLVCPQGELEQAIIMQILYCDALPPPSENPALDSVHFEDGTVVEYDSDAHHLTITAVKDVSIIAPGTLALSAGHVTIAAPVTQIGGDMTSDGISAQHHTHPQNAGNHYGGGTSTSEPQ